MEEKETVQVASSVAEAMSWRRKKVPSVLEPAPEDGFLATALSPEEVSQVRQLEDRRSMEAREELQRIRTMGRVSTLLTRLGS